MTTVALVTNGIASALHSNLELARRLTARGHDVTFLSQAAIGDAVAAHGHRFVPLTAPDEFHRQLREPLAALRERRFGAAIRGVASLPSTLRRARRATTDAVELIDALRALDPGLLVIDTEAHVAIIASSRLGIPTALTTFWFAIHRRDGVPPLDSSLGPGDRAALTRAWDEVVAGAERARRRRRWSRRGIVDLIGPVHYPTTGAPALRAVARRAGFDLASGTDDRQWLRPHAYPRLPTLTTNLWELEFVHEPPPNWHYVGPMVHLDRIDTAVASEARGRLAAFLAGRADDRPLVYCSLGSYWAADDSFLTRVVEAFRGRPDRDLVIGLGGRLDPGALGPLPDNVVALAWAPQVEVLGVSDAAIVHGGNAALNECVVQGVPMVVYSTGHLDQHGVAARVRHHRAGVVGSIATDTPDEIARNVDVALGDPAIRGRVAELRTLARDPARMARAVDLLERIAGEADRGGG